ncbi:antibiotic biosynthesis monooxygenase [Stappia sp. BW2]|uniref:antibiotic biosynthesis monooxygenase n=1 Tax=Stappia sp. BW2 TaxID=2592622 RepID=UPI0011DE79D5|nr:antibiotic biosynthesis monooxygenase [Stappia sp. BW2]TYC72298.1 antibiotic biosynthesis monooxygenase [Stappia sp. BW2]
MKSDTDSRPIYRVDRFEVPLESRDVLLERLTVIRDLLQNIEGCRQNLVLEQPSRGGTATFVTFVEWQNEEVFLQAKARIAEEYRKVAFDPQAFLQQIGAKAVMSNMNAV